MLVAPSEVGQGKGVLGTPSEVGQGEGVLGTPSEVGQWEGVLGTPSEVGQGEGVLGTPSEVGQGGLRQSFPIPWVTALSFYCFPSNLWSFVLYSPSSALCPRASRPSSTPWPPTRSTSRHWWGGSWAH